MVRPHLTWRWTRALLVVGTLLPNVAGAQRPSMVARPEARPCAAVCADPVGARPLRASRSDSAGRQSARPSRVPYVLGGAAVGAGIAVAGILIEDSPDDIFGAIVYPIVIAASALLGGLLGWLVHEIRY
jgi:hypothetical protein